MAEITAALVKQLRDATNVSMMACKKALIDAGGDLEQATRLLREQGMAVAAKKASRTANQGLIASARNEEGTVASLIEVNCETDFVARNAAFQAFSRELARAACDTDEPLEEKLRDRIVAQVAEIGENIKVARHQRFVLQGTGALGSYIHLGGKVGVLVELGCEQEASTTGQAFQDLVRDLTLHVAACNPEYLTGDEVPPDRLQAEREIFAKQVENKPPQIVEKIVDGKVKKFLAEICLLEQGFVKEPKQSVRQLLAETGKALGDKLHLRRYLRYQLGGA